MRLQFHLVDRSEEGDELVDVFDTEREAQTAAQTNTSVLNPEIYPIKTNLTA